MTQQFKPTVYLKAGCPFCVKLRVALLEMGAIDDVEIRSFSTGMPEEKEIRERLSTKLERVSFPTAEISPGEFRAESDELIAYFASLKGIAIDGLATLKAYVEGPFSKLMRLSKENRELRKTASP